MQINCDTQALRIACYQQTGPPQVLSARLVDASEGGLLVEIFTPPLIGPVVAVAAGLRSRFRAGLEGQARVDDCISGENGLFRIRLSFENVSYQSLNERTESPF